MQHIKVTGIAIATGAVLALTGCHSGSHHVSSAGSAAAKADATKGEQIVAACMKANTTARAIERCVVPKGSGPRLKVCVLHAVAANDPLTTSGRHALETVALPQCVEKYR